MEIRICKDSKALGKSAAAHVAQVLRDCIAEQGYARIVLSTGASQFDTLDALTREPGIKWECVEMFHLDEYVDLPETHGASFRKYLKERFVDKVGNLKKAHFVDGTEEGIKKTRIENEYKAKISRNSCGTYEHQHIICLHQLFDNKRCVKRWFDYDYLRSGFAYPLWRAVLQSCSTISCRNNDSSN